MSTHSLLYFLILDLACYGGASASLFRRFLHQPLFFPLDSFPPSASPQPQPEPPFSSATPLTQLPPFFPSTAVTPPTPIPTPTHPPSPYLVTFPANISALLLPTSPSSSHSRRASVVVYVTLLSVAVLFALSALILIHRRNRNAAGFSSDKSSHADGLHLVPPNTYSSFDDAPRPSAARPPRFASTSSSSEFLNPGVHSSSNHYVDVAQEAATTAFHSSTSAQTSYTKLGSPELRPLPLLPRVPTHWSGETISFYSKKEGTKKEEDRDDNGEDEFFSPRGSSSHRGSTGSPDLRPALNPLRGSEFMSRFGSRSLNSRNASYPYTATMYGLSRNSTSISGGNAASLQMDSGSPEPVLKFLAPTNVSVSRAMPLNSPTLSSSTSSLQSHSETHKFKTFTQTTPIIRPARNLSPPQSVPPRRFWENPISQDPISWLPGALAGAPSEQRRSNSSENSEGTPLAKLKPLHWDKVTASSDRTIVWDHIKSASFQLNEEMIETLFLASGSAQKEDAQQLVLPLLNQENQVLDPKKSQNILIMLKALNVTVDEVCESLMEGNVDSMGSKLLKILSKMAPTKEEERKLVEFNDLSPMNLGAAEMFLKALLNVPFAFKRVDAMLYIANFNAETEYLRKSFETLKAACGELRNNKLFLKLLEAVLKTGNRMNVGTNLGDARAFELDTLLKLADVKGKDRRTTLLQFVVQEISRIYGMELSKDNDRTHQSSLGLQVVAGLSGDLTNVKKAATMDSCILSNKVAKLADGLMRIKDVLRMCCDERNDDRGSKFTESMRKFILEAGEQIASVQAEESATLSLVREATEYFHGNSGKEEAHPFRIFHIVKDFLSILDRVCKELGSMDERSIYGSAVQHPSSASPSVQPLCPVYGERREIPSRVDNDGP